MSSSQTPSRSSTSLMPVSLPSIHEMFPDHLMRKDAHHCYDSERPRSHSGYGYPESPGVHHPQHRHPVSAAESQSGRRSVSHAVCPPTSHHNLPTNVEMAQIHDDGLCEPALGKKHASTLNSSQNIYPFNVLRSSPTLSSLQHITSSSTLPNRPTNPQQLGHNTVVASGSSPAFRVSPATLSAQDHGHEGQEARHGREPLPPYTSSPEGRYISSPRTRAPAGIDPYPAIISFPVSRPGPLPPASSKHYQHYPSNASSRTSGVPEYDESYSTRGPFYSNGRINEHGTDANEEEDEGLASTGEDNDTSNGKKHVCPTCFKRFNRPSSLRIHVNTHTGATPFRCPWPNCGREFNVNSNMRRHYRNHTTPGFSRSQNSSNSNNANSHPNDGRRKRRRASAPQIPPPTSATSPTPGSPSHRYPLGHAPYRSEHHYRHPPAHSHRSPHDSYLAHHAHTHSLHGSHLRPQQGPFTTSPPISRLSLSDEDSTSGSDSDMDEDKYPALQPHINSKKEVEDDLLEYEPDSSSLGYRTASLTQSLARVAVASNNGVSRRGHPYGLYSPTYHASAHDANGHDAPRRMSDHDYGHRNGYPDPHRPLTPGSSFHSSSPSPSVSPSPPPSANMHSSSSSRSDAKPNYKYSASTPYVRSLADSRVSTTLRPAFGNSSERERIG